MYLLYIVKYIMNSQAEIIKLKQKTQAEIIKLKQKIEKMEKYITELDDHLKKYTNSTRHLKYYENNKDVVKKRTKNYVDKLKTENPEKVRPS
jgi:tRNA U34 5-carboxymethylaminomethyl modifying GTPase MnmE/TrmE